MLPIKVSFNHCGFMLIGSLMRSVEVKRSCDLIFPRKSGIFANMVNVCPIHGHVIKHKHTTLKRLYRQFLKRVSFELIQNCGRDSISKFSLPQVFATV